jgi:O-antigen/teichoic acid export membrane protein
MYWFVNVSDRYLITYFHSVEVTGGYAVVYATASGLSIVSMAVGTVLFPDLSALRANNEIEEYRRRLSNVLRYYFVITVPAAVGLLVIADPLLRLLSTTSISRYTNLIFALAPAMVAYGLLNILIQALLSDGRSRVSALIWGGIAALNLGGNIVLVPLYSAMGASATTLGSFMIGLGVVMLWKRNDITIPVLLPVKVLLVSAIMGASVVFVRSILPTSDIAALPVLIGTGVMIYGILGFISGFLTKQDVEFVVGTI